MINNFGREFVGRKKAKGVVLLQDVKQWINSRDIFNAFSDWQHIIEEGDLHLSPMHEHKKQMMEDRKLREAAMLKARAGRHD